MSEQLLPCKICGCAAGEVSVGGLDHSHHTVRCIDCGVEVTHIFKARANATWNKLMARDSRDKAATAGAFGGVPRALQTRVEFLPGTEIVEAAHDMCIFSNQVNALVVAKFNDVELWATPNDDPRRLVNAYYIQQKSDARYKIARASAA